MNNVTDGHCISSVRFGGWWSSSPVAHSVVNNIKERKKKNRKKYDRAGRTIVALAFCEVAQGPSQ